ncbi:MAG: TonB-dependent receptor [Methylophilaceae bacterium]|jgi:outer membrane receptor protein involved in Fe transport
MKLNLIFVLLLTLIGLPIYAEESLTTGTIDIYTGTPLPSIGLPSDMVPSSIQTVKSKQISEQPGVSIADYMTNNLQGVTVNEIGGNPYQTEIFFRGYNATPISGNPQGLSVYVDGVRANQPFSNTVQWDLIPDFAIQDMQLVAGSNPVYGLNTLGGAISVQTKSGRSFNKGAADLSGGSWGRKNGLIEYGGVSEGGGFDYYVGYNYFEEDGWRDYSPSYVNQFFAKWGFESETGRYDISYTGAHNKLIGNGLTPKDLMGSNREGIHTLEDETNNNYGKLVWSGNEFLDDVTMVSGNAYWYRSDRKTHNGDLNDDYCDDDTAAEDECSTESQAAHDADGTQNLNEGVWNRTGTKQDAYGLNGQITFDDDLFDSRNQLVVGTSAEYSVIKFNQTEQEVATLLSSGFFGGALDDVEQTTGLTGKTKTFSLYATNTHSISEQWNFNVAARYNFIQVDNQDTYNAAGSAASLTGKHHYERVNPSVGITFHPSKDYTTYASYSEANRAPTSIELGCSNESQPCNLPTQMADDPPLEQVVAKTFEIGARGKFIEGLTWNAALYSAKNEDDILFVYANASNGLGFFKNVSETTREGLDVGINANYNNFNLALDYSFVAAKYGSDFTIANEVNSSSDGTSIQVKDGDYLPNIPKHSLKLRATYDILPEWYVGTTITAFSKAYMMGNENQNHNSSSSGLQGELPGYTVVNLDSNYQFFEKWSLYFKAINIFDHDYYTGGRLAETRVQSDRSFGDERNVASLLPGSPRAAWLGLRYEF